MVPRRPLLPPWEALVIFFLQPLHKIFIFINANQISDWLKIEYSEVSGYHSVLNANTGKPYM